jgi:hypothetical protein
MGTYVTPFGASNELYLTVTGPADRIRSIEAVDAATKQLIGQYRPMAGEQEPMVSSNPRTFNMALRQTVSDELILRINYFDRSEFVEIPFDVTTGIGL